MTVKTDTIINDLTSRVKNKEPISPADYLDAAFKLNMLLADEQEILYDWQQKVAQLKNDAMIAGDTAARAKIKVEASEEHKQYCIQKARIERIIELIRLAKIQARISNEEYHGYNL